MGKLAGIAASGLAWLIAAAPAYPATLTTDLSVVAANAAGLQPFVDTFRAVLGPDNGNAPVAGNPVGRREISWDDAVVDVVAPNAIPGDYYNQDDAPLARGIEFSEVGRTTGFAISSTFGFGDPMRLDHPDDFFPFTGHRMFSPVAGTAFDISFFDPATQVDPALSRGLGIVFSDVELMGSTTVTLFDQAGDTILRRVAQPGETGGLSFVGLVFDVPVIARARITSGNVPLGANAPNFGETHGADAVALDDLIFGEPVPSSLEVIPLPAGLPLLLGSMGVLALTCNRKGRTRRTSRILLTA